jgi:hypothetical protein
MSKTAIILSQNVPKFELLKHNDELLNISYGTDYAYWIIQTKFGWNWPSGF